MAKTVILKRLPYHYSCLTHPAFICNRSVILSLTDNFIGLFFSYKYKKKKKGGGKKPPKQPTPNKTRSDNVGYNIFGRGRQNFSVP